VGDDSMLYATVRTGFRAGGFTGGSQNIYAPEKLTAYEVGSKTRFFDQRLQANLALFHWSYDDQQISTLRQYFLNGISLGQTSYPFSVDGWLRGAELDLQAALSDADSVQLNVLYADGEYDETPPLLSSIGVTMPLEDQPRFNVPEWQVTAGYSHEFSLGGAGTLTAGTSAHYESEAILRLADLPLLVPGERKDEYIKWDADLTWRAPNAAWSVQAYIRNITNEAIIGVGSSGQSTAGVWYKPNSSTTFRSASLEPPRTYGVRISAEF
jgi:iron complex outermembrane receptor protein